MQNPPPPAPRIFPPIAPFDKQLSNKLSILLLDTFEKIFFLKSKIDSKVLQNHLRKKFKFFDENNDLASFTISIISM